MVKNKRVPPLLWLLAATTILASGLGLYLKYVVLVPLGLCQDVIAIAVPFRLLADETLREELRQPAPTLPTETTPPTTTEQTEVPTEIPTEEPTVVPTEPHIVTESWFDDALFIGDSRTEGLAIYAPLGKADYFCKAGMTVYKIEDTWCNVKGYGKTKLDTLLDAKSYGKIYIGLGLNEVGFDHDKVMQRYQKLLDMIREKQPDAVVILQSIMTVSRKKSNSASYFSLEHIDKLNRRIESLADGERIRFIDVNPWIADEEGYLPDDMSSDGCHLFGAVYADWSRWLLENAGTMGIA